MIIYTAIFGGKDVYEKPPAFDGVQSMVFGEDHDPLDMLRPWRPPALCAKAYKVVPHRTGLECFKQGYSLWLDGSVVVSKQLDLRKMIEKYLANADMALFRHPCRTSAEDEAKVCIDSKLDDPHRIMAQINRLKSLGVPNRLSMGGIILRRHTPAINDFGERWWWEIVRGSQRDQLSLDLAIDQCGIKYAYFDEADRPAFWVRKHVKWSPPAP